MVSIPQSGFGAFERFSAGWRVIEGEVVSIPQSGFGAFEPHPPPACASLRMAFQSLSRDSGRLNQETTGEQVVALLFQSLSRDSGRLNKASESASECPPCSFNPSVGIRGV